ncbi:DUF4397 domain-containing protein [Halomicrobium urmianum]|uniref:DUF4397 domain-containing protein n=1 Tax=Halomicrobium urmianum TaxID=1586233 RepID=UPI001CD9D213|nr:DUF4397 domain-containing protein [Halomicrobium urmianum]
MTEIDITRRRVVQGAGAIGVAGVFGSTVVSAQDGGGGGQQGSAVRVAHMSPDAPQVDVQIDPAGGGVQTGDDETDGGLGGNDTAGNATATEGGDDGGIQIEGVGFRDVSNYNEVDPGTYQVRIVPTESGPLGGLLGDLFGGGGDDDQTILYEDQIEVEENTTYTVAAFGEVSQGPVPAQGDGLGANETDTGLGNESDTGIGANESDVGLGGNETDTELGGNETAAGTGDSAGQGQQLVESLSFGESQTVEVPAGDYALRISEAAGGAEATTDDGLGTDESDGLGDNESDAALGGGTDQAGGGQSGFQVAVLEDDVSDPGGESARLQVFHAVPDVGPVSISAISADAAADGGTQPGNATGANETGAGESGNATDGVVGTDQQGVRQVNVTLEANTVYTGFASGYFDPEEAPQPGEGGADNQTGGALGGNDTAGNATDGGAGEDVAQEPDDAEFELVVVQDAQGGERSDGGTGGDIL